MKKILLISLLLGCAFAHQGIFQSVPEKDAVILQKGKDKGDCPICGMHLPMFYKTSHAVKFKDGRYKQYCSLHCVVDEMLFGELKDNEEKIDQILAVDAKTIKLIDAKKAFYVVGSKKPGTMSIVSKYAFKNRLDAQEFQKENGGEILNFEEAYKITLKEFGQ